jgi:hypothetical protein
VIISGAPCDLWDTMFGVDPTCPTASTWMAGLLELTTTECGRCHQAMYLSPGSRPFADAHPELERVCLRCLCAGAGIPGVPPRQEGPA